MIEIGEVEGKKIWYNAESKKFTVTLEVGGVKRMFTSSSEVGLRKKVKVLLKQPPLDAIEAHWWGICHPYHRKVVVSGNRLFALDKGTGRKKRVEPDSFRKYDEETFKKLKALWEEHERLVSEFQRIFKGLPRFT